MYVYFSYVEEIILNYYTGITRRDKPIVALINVFVLYPPFIIVDYSF